MTPLQLSKIITRKKLRQVDTAWLLGTSMRHIRYMLTGQKKVPQYARLLLMAYDEGLLTDDWLVKHILIDLPASSTNYD